MGQYLTDGSSAKSYFKMILSINEMDESCIEKAKEIFSVYKEKKILEDCLFEDDVWKSTDEYSNVGIYFNFNKLTYKKYYEQVLQMNYQAFINYVKIFISFILGKNVLHSVQTIVNDLKRIVRINIDDILDTSSELKLGLPNSCIDFFSTLPQPEDNSTIDELLNALDIYQSLSYRNHTDNKRKLAQFDSYFLFNDILNDYWKDSLDYEERLFFYPLYLWWHITGIIPLRPREFILTKRNCLEKKSDGYYLTLRRDNLKGRSKQVFYRISQDYYETTYKIPDALASEIIKYLDFTKQFDNTDLDTLFVTDTHYHKWGQKKHENSRYFTYINMNTVMKYFFSEVIDNKYHLNVIYNATGNHLDKGEIEYLHLGDTRHLALINIIAEGGTPVIAMQLAGHDSMMTAAHYYTNLTNLIECRTYRQYRLVTKGNVTYSISKVGASLPSTHTESILLSDGGKCYSEKYREGDIRDCLKTTGKGGEIGYCPECVYYRNKGKEFYSSDSLYKRKIEDDCNTLKAAIDTVRLGKGETEEIGTALLKLKSSSHSYQQYYNEKVRKLAEENKIWEERN